MRPQRSAIRSATYPSPSPNTCTMCDTMEAFSPPARKGTAYFLSIGISSDGGPGSITTRFPDSVRKPQPGAVPTSLGKTVQPSGSMACFFCVSPSSRPWKYRSICSMLLRSITSFFPEAAATVSFVRSSPVGPRPPVVIKISLRERAVSTALFKRSGLSPTVQAYSRLIPAGASSCATEDASVLTVWPRRSSVPTEMISAFIFFTPYRFGSILVTLTRETQSSTSPSVSSASSAFSMNFGRGRVRGCFGVKTVQQSS